MPKINGYLVVYYPETCRGFYSGEWHFEPKIRDNKKYRGLDRNHWDELGTAYWYDPNLSSELKEIYERIDHSIDWLISGIRISRSLKDIIKVLEFSNQQNPNSCEIIAIYSKVLSIEQGEFNSEADIQWIGYDVVRIGEWSFIEHGVFDCDELFEKWKDRLNEYGLIPDTGNYDRDFNMAQELIADYEHYEKIKRVEPMGNEKEYNDIIRIGLVDWESYLKSNKQ